MTHSEMAEAPQTTARLIDPSTGERVAAGPDEIRARRMRASSFGSISPTQALRSSRCSTTSSAFILWRSRTPSNFGQRPKIDDYDDVAFLVAYGAVPDDDGLVEVHFFVSAGCLVTVRRDDLPARLERPRARRALERGEEPGLLLHEIVDALVDSFFGPLADIDEQVSDLDDERLASGQVGIESEIFSVRRRLAALRRVIAPQRDVVQRIATGLTDLPGMSVETERRFRDVFDNLARIDETIVG